uniref:GG13523 n=1 Tax=Drosophila erecta TaxID=7220 RepID=B3P2M7_DROER
MSVRAATGGKVDWAVGRRKLEPGARSTEEGQTTWQCLFGVICQYPNAKSIIPPASCQHNKPIAAEASVQRQLDVLKGNKRACYGRVPRLSDTHYSDSGSAKEKVQQRVWLLCYAKHDIPIFLHYTRLML